jgi:hypothetical protein
MSNGVYDTKSTFEPDRVENNPSAPTEQISHFFQHYKELEKRKWVKLLRWKSTAEAKDLYICRQATGELIVTRHVDDSTQTIDVIFPTCRTIPRVTSELSLLTERSASQSTRRRHRH